VSINEDIAVRLQKIDEFKEEISRYKSIYRTGGFDAAVKQLKDDGRGTNWIMHYRDKIFPDKTLTEIEKAVKTIEKDNGMER
jgi:hypothetical protein